MLWIYFSSIYSTYKVVHMVSCRFICRLYDIFHVCRQTWCKVLFSKLVCFNFVVPQFVDVSKFVSLFASSFPNFLCAVVSPRSCSCSQILPLFSSPVSENSISCSGSPCPSFAPVSIPFRVPCLCPCFCPVRVPCLCPCLSYLPLPLSTFLFPAFAPFSPCFCPCSCTYEGLFPFSVPVHFHCLCPCPCPCSCLYLYHFCPRLPAPEPVLIIPDSISVPAPETVPAPVPFHVPVSVPVPFLSLLILVPFSVLSLRITCSCICLCSLPPIHSCTSRVPCSQILYTCKCK
jgi:hypothetical protein